MSKTVRSSRVSRTAFEGTAASRLSPAEQEKLMTLSPRLEKLSLGPRSDIRSANHEESANVPFSEKQKMLTAQIQAMIQNLELECYKLIFDVFPEKIQHLDDMYKQRKEFNLKKEEYTCPIPEFDEPTGDATEVKRKLARIHVPQNKAICDLFTILQKEILEMSEMINSLSIWVKLNVPRIADGNNFGVEVQGEISQVLESTEGSGYEILDSFTTYHNVRGNLIVQAVEHPGIQDFKESLKELDEKTYIKTSLLSCELRNDYITLYDMLSKNLDTLMSPRGKDESEKIARMY